jgi:hypothetical protein
MTRSEPTEHAYDEGLRAALQEDAKRQARRVERAHRKLQPREPG